MVRDLELILQAKLERRKLKGFDYTVLRQTLNTASLRADYNEAQCEMSRAVIRV